MKTKQCTKCLKIKSLLDFHKCRSNKDGSHYTCKTCRKSSEYRASGEQKLYKSLYYKSDHGRYTIRIGKLKSQYNLSESKYRLLLDKQKGCCSICYKSLESPHVDHDHLSGEVRGLLCSDCNLAIGLLGDTLKGVESAVKYLREHYEN